MRLLFFSIFLLTLVSPRAQELIIEDRYDEVFGTKPAGYLGFRNQINLEDYAMGLELGGVSRDRQLAVFVTFDARPYKKRILEYQGNNLFYQYQEARFYIGVGAEYFKGFRDSRLGAFVQINPQYTWGELGGTTQKPDRGWVITPRLGLAWDLNDTGYFKLGYAYLDAKTFELDKHRIYISINGFLTRQ